MLVWAERYFERGLSIIPLKHKDKAPLTEWKEFQQRLPTKEELRQWFSNGNRNIGIICGKVSGNLIVIDFDSVDLFRQFLEGCSDFLRDRVENTWVVETGRGYHVYFRILGASDEDLKTRRFKGVDIKGEASYVVAPPSIHPSGKMYEFKRGKEIAVLTPSEFRELVTVLKKLFGDDEVKPKIGLNDAKVKELIDLLAPHWKPGKRHKLALMIAGALYWHGYSEEDARAVIQRICEVTEDEEIKDRLKVVETTYNKAENVAYKKWLEEWLEESGFSGTEYEEVACKLLDIIKGGFLIGGNRIVARKSETTFYVADYLKNTIIELGKKNEKEAVKFVLRDTIATAVPTNVTIIREEYGESLKVEFTASDGYKFVFEGDLDEIISQLKNNTLRVTSRRKIEDALSLIISTMINKGFCQVQYGARVPGFYFVDGELRAYDFDTTPPTKEELREALQLLNEFMSLSSFSRERVAKLSRIAKWFIIAPFGWVLKQHNSWMPDIFIHGESDTGKTKSAMFLASFYTDAQEGSLGTIDSPYRMGNSLSKCTYPIIINEMNFDELDNQTLEIWKNAVEKTVVRSRYGKNIKAYAKFCFTSNSHTPIEKAIRKRLEVVSFDLSDLVYLRNTKEKFEGLFRQRDKLNAIGRFAFNYLSQHTELFNEDYDRIAERVFKEAYSFAELGGPEWLGLECINEEGDGVHAKAEMIRSYLYERLFKAGVRDPWNQPVEAEINSVPGLYFRNRQYDVVIRTPLLIELKKNGIFLSSLRDLVYLFRHAEYKPQVKAGGVNSSGVVVPFDEFFRWLGFSDPNDDGEDGLDDEPTFTVECSKCVNLQKCRDESWRYCPYTGYRTPFSDGFDMREVFR